VKSAVIVTVTGGHVEAHVQAAMEHIVIGEHVQLEYRFDLLLVPAGSVVEQHVAVYVWWKQELVEVQCTAE